MSNINTRIYGAPIPEEVQKVLEQRQAVAGTLEPNQSIDSLGKVNFPTENGSLADLSSKTPFARMWVCVELHDGDAKPKRIYDTTESPSQSEDEYQYNRRKEAFSDKNFGNLSDPDENSIQYDNVTKKFFIYDAVQDGKTNFTTRDFSVGRKVYALGNHVVNTEAVNPSEERTKTDIIFPSEHQVQDDNNKFLKPQSGITSIVSSTKEMSNIVAGALKETTVNFIVHNFHDFDKIYNRFFLKPGARVFLDFGWDINDLYDIDEENVEGIQEKIFGIGGFLDQGRGNLETLFGTVLNYDAKILQNGSVECSVTFTSKNMSLLNYDVGNAKERISFVLDNLIYLDGVLRSSNQKIKDANVSIGEEITDYLNSSNTGTQSGQDETLEIITNYLNSFAEEWWVNSDGFVPGNEPENDISLETGIFITSGKSKNYEYVQFGKIEDFLLNGEFGFGNSGKDINAVDRKEFESAFDSSNSFMVYNKILIKKQNSLSKEDSAAPAFLYPKTWYHIPDLPEGRVPYNVVIGKTPTLSTEERIGSLTSSQRKAHFDNDVVLERIPIREIFIRKDIVQSAFRGGTTLVDAMESILENINEDSQNVVDLKLASVPGDDTSFAIVDTKLSPEVTKLQDVSLVSDPFVDIETDLFEFDVMGKNSIVTSYDLSFKIPSDTISTILAIEGGSNVSQIIPTSDEQRDLISSLDLLSTFNNDSNNFTIQHVPYVGLEQINKQNERNSQKKAFLDDYKSKIDDLQDMIVDAKGTTKTNYKTRNVSIPDIETFLKNQNNARNEGDVNQETLIEQPSTTETLESKYNKQGIYVAEDINDYFNAQLKGGVESINKGAVITPIYLTLTIYGISSIQPGDIFRVNYIPEVYRNNVYFQTVKVSHQITNSGWSTTLETIMRIPEGKKNQSNTIKPHRDVILSSNFLNDIVKISSFNEYAFHSNLPDEFKQTSNNFLTNWVTKLKPVDGGISYEFIQEQLMKYRPSPGTFPLVEYNGKEFTARNPFDPFYGKVKPEPKNKNKKWDTYEFYVTDQGQGQMVTLPVFFGEDTGHNGEVYFQHPTYRDICFLDEASDKRELSWRNIFTSNEDFINGLKERRNLYRYQQLTKGDKTLDGYANFQLVFAKHGTQSAVLEDYPGGYHYFNYSGQFVPRVTLWKHDPKQQLYPDDLGHKHYMCFHPDYRQFFTIIRAD